MNNSICTDRGLGLLSTLASSGSSILDVLMECGLLQTALGILRAFAHALDAHEPLSPSRPLSEDLSPDDDAQAGQQHEVPITQQQQQIQLSDCTSEACKPHDSPAAGRRFAYMQQELTTPLSPLAEPSIPQTSAGVEHEHDHLSGQQQQHDHPSIQQEQQQQQQQHDHSSGQQQQHDHPSSRPQHQHDQSSSQQQQQQQQQQQHLKQPTKQGQQADAEAAGQVIQYQQAADPQAEPTNAEAQQPMTESIAQRTLGILEVCPDCVPGPVCLPPKQKFGGVRSAGELSADVDSFEADDS